VLVEAIISPPTTVVCCDPRRAGGLIGQGGATIRRIQDETGARVDVDADRDALVCTVTISGTPDSMEAARLMVESLVNPPSVAIECDQRRIGDVIGPNGATITGIQDQTGARIDVDSNVNPCTITISGTDEAIQAAGEIITSIVNPPTTVLTCDPSRVGDLIGPGGATINGIQEQTGARIDIDSDVTPCRVSVSGPNSDSIRAAEELIARIVDPPTATIECDQRRIGDVFGPVRFTFAEFAEFEFAEFAEFARVCLVCLGCLVCRWFSCKID
jgi:polyribonucleotide nucleotidyltransferase